MVLSFFVVWEFPVISQIPLPAYQQTGIEKGGEFYLFEDSRVWTAEAYASLSMMVAIP